MCIFTSQTLQNNYVFQRITVTILQSENAKKAYIKRYTYIVFKPKYNTCGIYVHMYTNIHIHY